MNLLRAHWRILTTSVLIVALLLVFYGPTDNWSWDPSFYYAQIRSPIIEHDLDFRNETIPPNGVSTRTVTGLQPSPWPVGPGILWAPFFLVTHAGMLLINPTAADGFAPAYIAIVSAGSALYGFLGLLVVYRTCCLIGSRQLAAMTTLLALMATPLLFYILRQPIMAHSASFFAAASLVMACILLERGTIPLPQSGMVLGVLVGLNILVRWTSVVLAILPVGLFLWYGVDALKRRDSRQLRILAGQSILGVLSGLMILAPQLALWERLYNQWVSFPTRGFSDQLLPPNILKLYVSTNRGILFWSPFLVVGLVGLIRFPYRKLRLLFLLYLLAFSILLGRWGDWYGGGGYGTRYFIEIVPIAAVGFVALLRGMSDQWSAKVGAGFLACLLIMHQLILLVTVEHGSDGWIPLDTYGKGEQLGIMIQVENSMRLLEYPLTLLQPRPFVALERQSLLVNYLAGHRDLKVFAFSLTALLIIPLGVVAVYALQKQRGTKLLRDVALIMLIYMTGWFIYVLYV